MQAGTNRTDIAQLLLESGAQLENQDSKGNTPLVRHFVTLVTDAKMLHSQLLCLELLLTTVCSHDECK